MIYFQIFTDYFIIFQYTRPLGIQVAIEWRTIYS